MSSIGSVQPTTQPTQQILSAPNSGFVLASAAVAPTPALPMLIEALRYGGAAALHAFNAAVTGLVTGAKMLGAGSVAAVAATTTVLTGALLSLTQQSVNFASEEMLVAQVNLAMALAELHPEHLRYDGQTLTNITTGTDIMVWRNGKFDFATNIDQTTLTVRPLTLPAHLLNVADAINSGIPGSFTVPEHVAAAARDAAAHQAQTGVPSAQLAQPDGTSGGSESDPFEISPEDLAAMMLQQAANFSEPHLGQGGDAGMSFTPIVVGGGGILRTPGEGFDPEKELGISPTGVRRDLFDDPVLRELLRRIGMPQPPLNELENDVWINEPPHVDLQDHTGHPPMDDDPVEHVFTSPLGGPENALPSLPSGDLSPELMQELLETAVAALANPVTTSVGGQSSIEIILKALNQMGVETVAYSELDGDKVSELNTQYGHLRADASLETMSNIVAVTVQQIAQQYEGVTLIPARLGGDEFKFLAFGPNALQAMRDLNNTLQANLAASSRAGNPVPQISGVFGELRTELANNIPKLRQVESLLDDLGIELTKPKDPDAPFNRSGILEVVLGKDGYFPDRVHLGPTYDFAPTRDGYTQRNNVSRAEDGVTQPNVTSAGTDRITSRPVLLPGIEIDSSGDVRFGLSNEILQTALQQMYGPNFAVPNTLENLKELSQIEHIFWPIAGENPIYNLPTLLEKIDGSIQDPSVTSITAGLVSVLGMRQLNSQAFVVKDDGTHELVTHGGGDAAIRATGEVLGRVAREIWPDSDVGRRRGTSLGFNAPNATPEDMARFNLRMAEELSKVQLTVTGTDGVDRPVMMQNPDGSLYPFVLRSAMSGVDFATADVRNNYTAEEVLQEIFLPRTSRAPMDVVEDILKGTTDPDTLALLESYINNATGPFRHIFPQEIQRELEGPGSKDTIKGGDGKDPGVNGEIDDALVSLAPRQNWLDANRANLLAGTSLAGYGGQLFDMLDQRGLGNLLFAGSKIGAAAFNPNASSIVGGLIGLAGRFGGEDVQKIAGDAALIKSVGDAILNPGPGTISAVLGGALGRFGVDPAISDGVGLGGQALQMALFGGGPLAAVGLALAFAQFMDARVGQPNVIRLSTQLDGQEIPVEYNIGAKEYHHFRDSEGREAHSFNGGVFEMDGKYYLGGSFGYDALNALTEAGEGGMPGAILGLPGGFIQKRGDGSMMESLEIDKEVYDQLLALNGGSSQLQAAAGDPIFALVAPRMGLVEEVRYTSDGLMSDLMPGVTLLDDPIGGNAGVKALFSNPLIAGHHNFRDPDQAGMFDAFGLMAAMMVAGNPDLARSLGGFDAQRILDHFAANAESMTESPMFDVYGYLAANPDVAQAVGPNLMDAIRHYLDAGIHEGRSTQASEEAKLGAMARVAGLALYDEATYLALNPDVAEAVARGDFPDGRAHYEAFGFDEGRMAFFDETAYLAANPGLAEALAETGGTPLEHYVLHGRAEGRPLAPPAPVAPEGYDEALYLQQNPDVAAAVEAGQIASGLEHFHLFGEKEGRSPGIVPEAPTLPEGFDAAVYMNQNPDILQAGIESGKPLDEYAIEHYHAFGKDEGRAYA